MELKSAYLLQMISMNYKVINEQEGTRVMYIDMRFLKIEVMKVLRLKDFVYNET